MVGVSLGPALLLRPVLATIALLAAVVLLANVLRLGGLAVLAIVLWAVVLGAIAVGVFLIVHADRPGAGAGAIVTAISIGLQFFWRPEPWVIWIWTALFFVGVALIARGTREDTPDPRVWPLLLPRVGVGWALIDNAQDHFWASWLPGGGPFLQTATQASTRPPMYFFDPPYQAFLGGIVAPNADLWAAFVICGELAFGVMLAVGFLTPIGAVGAMWLNANYALMKGFVAHSAYTDKTFFAVELFCLIAAVGLAYGLDATLRRFAPPWAARTLMAVPGREPEPVPTRVQQPA